MTPQWIFRAAQFDLHDLSRHTAHPMSSQSTPVQRASPPPSSILIIGAGVFGLSTALSLLLSRKYKTTRITLLDTHAPLPSSTPSESYNPNAASIDNSRIVRGDYSNPLYTRLADQAQEHWRNGFVTEGIYRESGLVFVGEKGKSGWEYIEKSENNVQQEATSHGEEKVQRLNDPEEIRKALKTGGSSGSAGYINYASGWVDAGAAMAEVRDRVSGEARKQGRTVWKRGKAVELVYAQETQPSSTKPKCRRLAGVRLDNGDTLYADLTILAAGAWSGSLLDLRGRVEASAQVLAYISLTPSERSRLQAMPVCLNLGTGLFAMPPSPAEDSQFKIARHGYGYRNPTSITDSSTGHTRTVSLPAEQFSPIPMEGERACRKFLGELIPWLAEKPFVNTRLCWYTDTPEGDFIIDYHPEIEGLFLATGGSGHGFKFLPVIGERVVQAVEGRLELSLRDLWRWPKAMEGFGGTEDGSRGGGRGMVLWEEWERDGANGARGKSKL